MDIGSKSPPGYFWYEVERRRTTAVQDGAAGTGWMLLLFGVMGFVPLSTPGLSGISFAGTETSAELFGVFAVTVLSNLVHLSGGVIGLVASLAVGSSRWYLLIGGACIVVLGVYGLFADAVGAARFLPADVWTGVLHLGLGFLMIVLGLALTARFPGESESRGDGERPR